MKIYRVSFEDEADGHWGYRYFEDEEKARTASDKWANGQHSNEGTTAPIAEADCPLTKEGVLAILNKWGSHNDNG